MPAIKASIEYLQNLPLYKKEKPYWCFISTTESVDPNTQRLDNLEYETHPEIVVKDIRELPPNEISLDGPGFDVLNFESQVSTFASQEDVDQYNSEVECLLRKNRNAVFVKCYNTRLRKNVPFQRKEYDVNDNTSIEGPARCVHVDYTYDSGPEVISRYLTKEERDQYLQPGFRIRLINTWRSLLPILEDRPLAICDGRTVDPSDLKAADRVLPQVVGEVYYVCFNKKHEWYWLEKQKASELLVFVSYDTNMGTHARYCPHNSFENVRAPENAPPRESIENRSIVVEKMV